MSAGSPVLSLEIATDGALVCLVRQGAGTRPGSRVGSAPFMAGVSGEMFRWA